MGAEKLLLCVVLLAAIAELCAAAGSCPQPSKIYTYDKKTTCRQDFDCKNGMICCLNPANVKSCTYPDPYSAGGSGGSKDPGNSKSVTCEGYRCQPYEVCKRDPVTKRLKCSRP